MSQTNEKLRVGVAGLNMGMGHLHSYLNNPDVILQALCDQDEAWLNHVCETAAPQKRYTRFEDMIRDPELDAISLCLPTSLHASGTIAALEAGKHVLCEKPMATCLADALAMKDAAERTGKKLMISHQQRFGKDIQAMKEKVDTGFFGDIYFIRIAWRRPQGLIPSPVSKRETGIYNRNWFNERANGGGVLRDLGTHLIDLSLFLSDFPALSSASGRLYRNFYPEGYDPALYTVDAEDHANALLKFENGMSVQLEVNFAAHLEEEVVLTELYGTKGGVSRRNGEVRFFETSGNLTTTTRLQNYTGIVKTSQEHFVQAVLQNTKVPITPAQGAEVVRILDAIYRDGWSN